MEIELTRTETKQVIDRIVTEILTINNDGIYTIEIPIEEDIIVEIQYNIKFKYIPGTHTGDLILNIDIVKGIIIIFDKFFKIKNLDELDKELKKVINI